MTFWLLAAKYKITSSTALRSLWVNAFASNPPLLAEWLALKVRAIHWEVPSTRERDKVLGPETS